jgi:DNA primase
MADIVQEIKLRTDLVELISQYVPLRKSGRTHKGLCPFHGEKTPSFTVDGERGFYRCYGCGKGGDCFSFLEDKEGLSFNEAGERLARRLGLEWVRRGDTAEKRSQRERLYDVNALAERFFCQSLERSAEVRAYLEKRGLAPETVRDFRLGYAPPGYEALLSWLKGQKASLEEAEEADLLLRGDRGLRDRFVDRLMFPIFDLEGRAIAFGGRTLKADGIPKYLNSRETQLFQKGKTLYGLHLAKKAIPDSGFTVAVEGYMDLIALHQAGIPNSVASLGTAITETHVGILRRYSNDLVLCYDGDSAGMRAAERSSAMFEAAGCNARVAQLPQGADPDTYIKEHGADAFRALVNRAAPLLDYRLDRLRAEYNLSDESARLPFVREAVRIIVESGSHLVRESHTAKLIHEVERLAGEWHQNDPPRALEARSALIREVNRLLRTEAGNGHARPARDGRPALKERPSERNGRAGGAAAGPGEGGAAPLTAQSRAERYVLRAALTESRWAEEVSARLDAAHFSDPALQGIAAALLGNNEGPGPDSGGGRAEAVRGDPAMAEAASALLIEDAPLSDEGLESCLLSLERAWKQHRKEALMRAWEAGEIRADDPRREELVRLNTELGGRQRRDD